MGQQRPLTTSDVLTSGRTREGDIGFIVRAVEDHGRWLFARIEEMADCFELEENLTLQLGKVELNIRRRGNSSVVVYLQSNSKEARL
jgi:hypothetical protein